MTRHTEASSFDFDAVIDRNGTGSIKWSGVPGDALAMGLADMDFRTAPGVTDALRERVEHGIFGYTQSGPDLTGAVCRWLAERRGWHADAAWIVPTPGVMPSIAHLLQAWLDPGASVIVQTPAFGPIPAVIRDNGFRVEQNPLRLSGGRYVMDLVAFEAVARRRDVGAFVLCSPHNPSGRVWSRRDLESVAAICEANDVLVISDEVHADMVFPWADFASYALAAGANRYAIVFGPSKAFNLAGLRSALAVVPDADLRGAFARELQRVNEDFGIGIMASAATTAAYSTGDDWLDALTQYVAGNLDALVAGLADLDGVHVIRPDASFLVWIDVSAVGGPDADVTALLSDNGVIVEPGTSFGPDGAGFIRVNIGTARSRVEEAAVRIASALGA